MKFILDTDIGSDIDDAMALLLCLKLPDLELAAVTTVYNCPEIRAKIVKKMVDLAEADIPVGCGIGRPMDDIPFIWQTGLEGQGFLEETEFLSTLDADGIHEDGLELLVEAAKENPGIEVVSIGPLTNIAKAIQDDPGFKDCVSRIWTMIGGATYPNPIPEGGLRSGEWYHAKRSHNVHCDIEAAGIVLDSGIPVTMVGNDVTTKVKIDLEGIERIEKEGSLLNKGVVSMMRVWLDYRSRIFKRPVTWTCLHDALVVAEAMGLKFTEKEPVDVRLLDDGSTVVKLNPESKHRVCTEVRTVDFRTWYLDRAACPGNIPRDG
jgi:purine nucleosidase